MLLQYITNVLTNIRMRDVIDILVVAIIFYKLFTLIKETRAEQLIKGIIFLLVLTKISEWMELFTINWILSNAMTLGAIAILVVFQPELRRGLEYLGRSSVFTKSLIEIRGESLSQVVEELIEAIASLSDRKSVV